MQEEMGVNMRAYNEQYVRYKHTWRSPDIMKNDKTSVSCKPGDITSQCLYISKNLYPCVTTIEKTV